MVTVDFIRSNHFLQSIAHRTFKERHTVHKIIAPAEKFLEMRLIVDFFKNKWPIVCMQVITENVHVESLQSFRYLASDVPGSENPDGLVRYSVK